MTRAIVNTIYSGYADATNDGAISTTAQVIPGDKTFIGRRLLTDRHGDNVTQTEQGFIKSGIVSATPTTIAIIGFGTGQASASIIFEGSGVSTNGSHTSSVTFRVRATIVGRLGALVAHNISTDLLGSSVSTNAGFASISGLTFSGSLSGDSYVLTATLTDTVATNRLVLGVARIQNLYTEVGITG